MVDLTSRRVEDQPENPYNEASLLSKTFFFWLNPFIKKGFQKDLTLDDLYRVPNEDLSKDLGQKLTRQWNKELEEARQGRKASLVRALWRTFGFWYLMSGVWITLGEIIIRPLQAVSLGWLISNVNLYLTLDPTSQADQMDEIYWKALYNGLLLVFLSMINLIAVHPHIFYTQHVGMKLRVACCHLIYRHALKLSNAAIGQTTVGQMVNLLTNDVNRFDVALSYLQYLVVAPIQAIIVVTILSVSYLGFYATASGSLILLLYVPFQSFMGRWFGRLRHLTAERTDERIRLMNEIIPAMRVIKMYTWEDPFANLVELARENEVRLIKYTSILRGINMALFFVSSKIILFISFITYVLLGYTLDAEIVFVSITMFNAVRLLMTLFFPYGVAQLAETLISCGRLEEFLLLPKQENSSLVQRENLTRPSDVLVECQNASANWIIVNKTFTLEPLEPLEPQDEFRDRKRASVVEMSSQARLGSKRSVGSSQLDFQATHNSVSGLNTLGGSRSSLFSSQANVHLSSTKQRERVRASEHGAPKSGQQAGQLSGQLNPEQTAITAIRNISYQVRGGEIMVIVGRVGSGKSSVLMSILGELPIASGLLRVRGQISYASQESWIFAGTVRQNVLFNRPFNSNRYRQVLRVCSLDKDIELFPQGDQTVVGERGVSLSGGQRARINLARAIYHDADIYLLDDPLSAVDATVARHIFNECILGFLKGKAVLLATHQTQFIRKDTRVLFLREGQQVSCRSYSDSKELHGFLGGHWDKSDSELAAPGAGKPGSGVLGRMRIDLPDEKLAEASTASGSSGSSSSAGSDKDSADGQAAGSGSGSQQQQPAAGGPEREAGGRPEQEEQPGGGGGGGQLARGEAPIRQQVESAELNSLGASIYWHYIRASGACFMVAMLAVTNLGTQVLFNGSDFWLSYWTDTEQRKALNGGSMDYPAVTLTDTLTLYENSVVYTILIAGLFLLTLVRTTSFFIVCMRSSINLHKRLFQSVVKAPIKFFDCNPIGFLLNRVSRDMGIVDDLLPPTAFDAIEIFVNVLGTLITVGIIYPINLIPATVLCSLVFLIRLFYMRTVRSIKGLEGVTRSPVFSHLAASLNGLATIRAFKSEPEFEEKFDQYQDIHSSAWFLFVSASRWLGNSLDWVSLCYIAVITVVMTLTMSATTGAQIGLAISSSLFLSGSFQWGVRQSTEMESQMTSVARIKEYSELPEEPARRSPAGLGPVAGWPHHGSIQFKGVNLRYFAEDEPVLKELNFTIRPAEKVGVVGRTGAGKSSIIAVLFRLTEPEGQIFIDGLDTKSVGLHELRRKLSIIPQEPILFSGPVRRNLDPFGEYADQELWRALKQVKLSSVIRQLPGALDAELNEGGSNFSVGERQLICLARAILRQNRIIVLDEATANVDPDTDKFIQRTISKSFTDCTRITIAHRLHTIMDSDRVLVMDAGRVREFDEPHLLLQNETGLFSTMVKNSGKSAAHLRKIARNSYEKRHAAGKTRSETPADT